MTGTAESSDWRRLISSWTRVSAWPVSAPWMRASEAIEFAREVRAPRNLAIHDRVYSEAGLKIVDGHMNAFLPEAGQEYVRLPDGQDL